ncbi:hypothetical protein ACIGZJ_15745 [Kitasatospora sp. NPDC052868]|uniref:hypothetical protein n=1 Tax=Kitasatospora sp. NPDC052868 TaxID=3364060 RepID=UPI0037C947F2
MARSRPVGRDHAPREGHPAPGPGGPTGRPANRPTGAELVAAAVVFAVSLALAFVAAALVAPGEPAAARVVWWTTLAAALMRGVGWSDRAVDRWHRRRDSADKNE